jgi:hypothetical protein
MGEENSYSPEAPKGVEQAVSIFENLAAGKWPLALSH